MPTVKVAQRLVIVSTMVDVIQQVENAIAAQDGLENHARRNVIRGSSVKTVPSNAFANNPRLSLVILQMVDVSVRQSIEMVKRLNMLA